MPEKEENALAEVYSQCFLLKRQTRIQEHPTIAWHYLGPLFYLDLMLNEQSTFHFILPRLDYIKTNMP